MGGRQFIAVGAILLASCTDVRQRLVAWFDPVYVADAATPTTGKVQWLPVVSGLAQPTDIQFPPGQTEAMVVLQKTGEALAIDLNAGTKRELARFAVMTSSEQGLLGVAFHPNFAVNRRAFVNLVRKGAKGSESAVVEVAAAMDANGQLQAFKPVRDIYVVAQPYQNHDAGQLAFGPDGYLYIGWGDGGWRDDPHGHGQNLKTALGAMLRIDVDRQTDDKPYHIPPDNPFVGQPEALPEIWAYGLRNPWRYSFAPDGRLIVADVGQNLWEEVNILKAGGNYGWNRREGMHCFPPDAKEACRRDGLIDPIWEYGRDLGQSITGGYVYSGDELPWLQGRYIVGDFVSGRVWALKLPAGDQAATDVVELGKWPMLISTFGWNGRQLFVADFGQGAIYRLAVSQ